jgi:hypothetical protein
MYAKFTHFQSMFIRVGKYQKKIFNIIQCNFQGKIISKSIVSKGKFVLFYRAIKRNPEEN